MRVQRKWAAPWLCILGLTGCMGSTPPAKTQIFAMDTIMSLEVYHPQGEVYLQESVEQIYDLDRRWNPGREGSELWEINHSQGEWTAISPDTWEIIQNSVALGELTQGALDITTYPGILAWGFTTGDYRIPDSQELEQIQEKIDFRTIQWGEEYQVRLPEGFMLDLGAVAKGYAGQKLAQTMREKGVEHGLFYLGGNVQTLGSKPDGTPWRIGLQDPMAAHEEVLAVISVVDQAVITSGNYQRYFEKDGTRYWHILDPETGAPARSGLSSVTVVGSEGTVCDALSTALFVMGQEDGAKFWRDHPQLEVELIWVDQEGDVTITQGLEENFQLMKQDRGYEVVQR